MPPPVRASIAAPYQDLLLQLDRWFADAAARHPGVIPCRSGCTACCHGPFDISAADAALLRAGLATLDPATRAEVRGRAEFLLLRMKAMAPSWGPPYDLEELGETRFDEIVEALADEPCPLLGEEGACTLYSFRPAICRMMGLGMHTTLGNLANACPIQDQFPEYRKLKPERFDLATYERREEQLIAGAGGGETTIAA
ncbi:MAG: YkgJ family cysteine cluster protein, partial [Gemmatimonadales bacterium]